MMWMFEYSARRLASPASVICSQETRRREVMVVHLAAKLNSPASVTSLRPERLRVVIAVHPARLASPASVI